MTPDQEMVIDTPIGQLGERLRAAREARRLTLEVVAERSGLTKGYVSKVERNQATPSVAVLIKLCTALDLSIGDLFNPQEGRDLVKMADRQPITFGGTGLVESLITPAYEGRVQVIHSVIEPGGGSGEELYRLPSDVEVVFVVSGRLTITISDRVVELAAGDTITFSPQEPHSFYNPDSNDTCEVVWTLVPALPQGWEKIYGYNVST
jgi:transcriptional regulator with XRE-family HTH domain